MSKTKNTVTSQALLKNTVAARTVSGNADAVTTWMDEAIAAKNAALNTVGVKDREGAILHMLKHKEWFLEDMKTIDAYELRTVNGDIRITTKDFLKIINVIQPRPTTASRLTKAWNVLIGKEE